MDETPLDLSNPPDPTDKRILPRRADGLVWCCSTLGWVTEAVAFDHRSDTSRPPDEYLNERAPAWDAYVKERGG